MNKKAMHTIPYADVRADGLKRLVDRYPNEARDLVQASRRTFGWLSDFPARFLLPRADRIARSWLARTRNPYLAEIDHYARQLGTDGIYALNICYEWGCTSAVYAKGDGPTLTRVLDWPFPKLGEHIVVAHQSGKAGEFYNVTWPGVSGVFQGMAPGRFSASLNQAPMRRHGLTYPGNWLKNRTLVFRQSTLPPEHLLRQVFEEAANFEEAKERLCKTPVALPVIYILAGVQPDEGCVIERRENDFAIRPLDGDRVCAANQFETSLNTTGKGWTPRRINSKGRAKLAKTLPIANINEDFDWFQSPIANAHSRLVMMSSAASGTLSVFGTHGKKPVTGIFKGI